MRSIARHLARPAAILALASLAGCVGAPAPGPVVYQQGYPPPQQQSGYAPQQDQAAPPSQVAYGYTCYAGVYTCTLPQQIPVGSQCSCPGLGAPSYGNVR